MAFTPFVMPAIAGAGAVSSTAASPTSNQGLNPSTQARGIFGRLRTKLRQRVEQQLAQNAAEKAADELATQPPAGATQAQSFATAAASQQAQRTRRRAAAGNAGPRTARAGRRSAAQGTIQPMGQPLILIGGGS